MGKPYFQGSGAGSRHLPPPPQGALQGGRPRGPAGAGGRPGERGAGETAPRASAEHPGPPSRSGSAALAAGAQAAAGGRGAQEAGGRGARGAGRRSPAAGAKARRPAEDARRWEARSPRRRRGPGARARAAASAERAARITWCACRRSQRAHNGALGVCAQGLPAAGRSRLLRLQRLHASPPGGVPEPAGRPGGRGRAR